MTPSLRPDTPGYHPVRQNPERRGLVLVYTGDGKGKTTAALGLAVRALGQGFSIRMFQFIKGARPTGEWEAAKAFGGKLSIVPLGDKFTWETKDPQRNRLLALEGWDLVKPFLSDASVDLLVLDEINVVLAKDLLPLAPVLAALQSRPAGQHVVLTGRGAPATLIEAADLVSEIRMVKHPFKSGIKAQPGIEF